MKGKGDYVSDGSRSFKCQCQCGLVTLAKFAGNQSRSGDGRGSELQISALPNIRYNVSIRFHTQVKSWLFPFISVKTVPTSMYVIVHFSPYFVPAQVQKRLQHKQLQL